MPKMQLMLPKTDCMKRTFNCCYENENTQRSIHYVYNLNNNVLLEQKAKINNMHFRLRVNMRKMVGY